MGEKGVIAKLLNNLTYLQLAIKQVAAYVTKNTMSILDYLEIYESSDKDLIYLVRTEFEDQG
jgi:hypothetical protein